VGMHALFISQYAQITIFASQPNFELPEVSEGQKIVAHRFNGGISRLGVLFSVHQIALCGV
jgi:hypothetical protein